MPRRPSGHLGIEIVFVKIEQGSNLEPRAINSRIPAYYFVPRRFNLCFLHVLHELNGIETNIECS